MGNLAPKLPRHHTEKWTEPRKCLIDIQVDFKDGESKEEGYILEIDGESNDVNYGFGGKYVYLIAKWGTTDQAMSDIEFVASEKSLSGDEYKNYTPNLDVGCHDEPDPLHPSKPTHPFRYLKKKYDHSKDKANYAITEVLLYRSKWDKSIPASRAYEDYTENMNKGRRSRK
eukprot:UN06021